MTIGIPYMGSKRTIARPIVDYIIAQNPQCKYFYDLFGGGGAISFEALQRPQFERVTYNELNTGVVELLKKIRAEGVTEEFYQWVSRETFNKHKNDSDWFGALVKTCWSFGNNQRHYLFGREIEQLKHEAHKYLLGNGYKGDKLHRLELIKQFKNDKAVAGRFELQQLEQLQQLQQLQQLERLQQLQRLEQLERLQITNQSYADVLVDTPISETVIYLDPPYFNTAKYAEQVCHSQLLDYVKTSPYKVYVSSYDFDLPCVWQIQKRVTLNGGSGKYATEKLFCNRPEGLLSEAQLSLF